MAFDTLQCLGEEKFRTVVQKLSGGTCESSVAKLIQEQWGDCQDVLENTLVEELKALRETASMQTRENGHVPGEENRVLQLRDSELGCLERLIHDAIVTENRIDALVKDGRLTDSQDRLAITLIKFHTQQIAMIHDMKLDLGLDAYKRGMPVEEIAASDQWEYEDKMKWIKADMWADKWLEMHNIIGADKEDFLNRYDAKYGKTQPRELSPPSSSPAAADRVPQEQEAKATMAASWDALQRRNSPAKRPRQ